uniref:hypothetical protein n=1 Tax=Faecalibacterium sp. TaxID=1971605 RepID=UPI003FF01431
MKVRRTEKIKVNTFRVGDVIRFKLSDGEKVEMLAVKEESDGMIVRAALLPINLSGNLLETLQKMVNMARETARLCKTEDKEAE